MARMNKCALTGELTPGNQVSKVVVDVNPALQLVVTVMEKESKDIGFDLGHVGPAGVKLITETVKAIKLPK